MYVFLLTPTLELFVWQLPVKGKKERNERGENREESRWYIQLPGKTSLWPLNYLDACNTAHPSEPEPGRSHKERGRERGKLAWSQSFSHSPHQLWQHRVDRVGVELPPKMTLKTLVSPTVLHSLAKVYPNKSSYCNIVEIKYQWPVDLKPTYKFNVCLSQCL